MALDPTADVTISHPDSPRHPFFSGPLKDAMEKIEREFPRHSADGFGNVIMSAQINHQDGGVSTYHDGTWTHPEDKTEEPEVTEPTEPVPTEPTEPTAPVEPAPLFSTPPTEPVPTEPTEPTAPVEPAPLFSTPEGV